MLDLYEELKAIISALEENGIDYALCGGLAMAVYGAPRATVGHRPADSRRTIGRSQEPRNYCALETRFAVASPVPLAGQSKAC